MINNMSDSDWWFYNIIMWFLLIAEELSVGRLNSPVEDSPFVLSPHIPDCVIFLGEALFELHKAVFFCV